MVLVFNGVVVVVVAAVVVYDMKKNRASIIDGISTELLPGGEKTVDKIYH